MPYIFWLGNYKIKSVFAKTTVLRYFVPLIYLYALQAVWTVLNFPIRYELRKEKFAKCSDSAFPRQQPAYMESTVQVNIDFSLKGLINKM